jgi:hypothetical protein
MNSADKARIASNLHDVACAVEAISCEGTITEATAGLGYAIAYYLRYGGDPAIAANLSRESSDAARALGTPDGDRLANALAHAADELARLR